MAVDNSYSEEEVRRRAGLTAENFDNTADIKENVVLKGYDDSKRINDPALAERMAKNGKEKREEAVRYREFADPATPFVIKDGKKWMGQTGYEINAPEEPIRANFARLAEDVDRTADKFEDIERSRQ
jgi:hypothetical protein